MAAWAEVYLLLWGILASTVTIHLAAPHDRNSPRIVRPLGSGVNPNLEQLTVEIVVLVAVATRGLYSPVQCRTTDIVQ